MKMLNVKIQMVQAIANYKISSMKSIKLKEVSVLELAKSKTLIKLINQNQDIGGNDNTQDQFAYNDTDANQNAEGDLIDQLQGSYDTNIQNQQDIGEG